MQYIVSPCPALKEHDYGKPVRADHLNEPGRITSQVIKLLMEAELVIADLTGTNANVYYELSLRHALGKPVIHMAADGTRLSFDVRDNRTIFYTMHSRIAERARNELAEQIRRVHQTGYKPTNPIIETAGIIKLEQSGDPQQKAIGQIMRMIESLGEQVSAIRQDYGINLLPLTGGVAYPPGGLFDLAALGRQPAAGVVIEDNDLARASRITLEEVAKGGAERISLKRRTEKKDTETDE